MARVLVISSQVAFGYVGLSAMTPVFQHLGHDVIGLPTVMLSAHPGHGQTAGEQVDPGVLDRMIRSLEATNVIDDVDAIVTGYLPSVGHAAFAASAVERVRRRNPAVTLLCDPVLGDAPEGLYIDEAAARAIKKLIVPNAGILTPNAFELQWLAEKPVHAIADAIVAARDLVRGGAVVAATSVQDGTATLANVLVGEAFAAATRVPWRADVPHGTGDVFASLFLSRVLMGDTYMEALSHAVAGVSVVIGASIGRMDLSLIMSMDQIIAAKGPDPDEIECQPK